MSRRDVLFLRPMVVWGVLGASALFLTVALLLTGQSEISMESSAPASGTSASGPVDQRQYATARTLAALAVTEQEKVDAVMALRAADHELDKDFAYAIQAAAVERQTLSGPALEISRHIEELHKTIKKDENAIADLPADAAADSNSDMADHRKLAQAQLALDNDALDLLQIELARRSNPGRIARSFEFRALAPVYGGSAFSVQARREADGSVTTWIADGKGGLAQQGKATFDEIGVASPRHF